MFSHETLTTTVLFDREIVRILDRHCVMCHAQNGPSFPLETYEQTWLQGRKLRADVIARHMPPWAAVPGYGNFANDNSLTLRETQFIVSWVEGLGPRNSGTVFTNVADGGAARQAVRAKPDFGHWQLGQPDLVREMEAVTVDPGRGDFVKQIVIPLGLTDEHRLRAIEFMPSDRRVVRAASFMIEESGQWIGGWTPWYGFMELPAGASYRLAARSPIVATIYYRSAKEPVVERSTLGLFFSDKPAPNVVSEVTLEAKGTPKENRFRAEMPAPADMRVIALNLDLQPGVKSIEVNARKPDGGTDVLLFLKDIPNDWPTPYIFKEPVIIRKGSVLSVTSYNGPIKITLSLMRP